jgi:hypothetical protein
MHDHATDVERTPLPKLQLSVLLFLRLGEPLVATIPLPFLNEVAVGDFFILLVLDLIAS